MNSKRLMQMVAPQKYMDMVELFSYMIFHFRMLGLHKKPTTFCNLCAVLESVGHKRNFTSGHLAQIKYLLPEEVKIDAIYVPDMTTRRMMPDMDITLLFNGALVVNEDQFEALRQLFVSRLVQFLSSKHPPDACDIPKAMLPEPFGHIGQLPHVGTAIEQVPFNIHRDFVNLRIQDLH